MNVFENIFIKWLHAVFCITFIILILMCATMQFFDSAYKLIQKRIKTKPTQLQILHSLQKR